MKVLLERRAETPDVERHQVDPNARPNAGKDDAGGKFAMTREPASVHGLRTAGRGRQLVSLIELRALERCRKRW